LFSPLPNFVPPSPQLFKNFFETNPHSSSSPSKDTATIMSIEGRAYPVDILYTKEPVPNYLTGVVETVLALHREQGPGDVLAFLTGQDEVEKAVAEIR
jgi:HrpA-like RNA helicase